MQLLEEGATLCSCNPYFLLLKLVSRGLWLLLLSLWPHIMQFDAPGPAQT